MLVPSAGWAGALLGAGAFQLFDGLINHKVLRVHQVRYDVDLLPYDLSWNLVAAALLLIGAAMTWRAARAHRPESDDGRR